MNLQRKCLSSGRHWTPVKFLKTFLFLLVVASSGGAFGQSLGPVEVLTAAEVSQRFLDGEPLVLYHHLSPHSLDLLAEQARGTGKFPLKKSDPEFMLSKLVPQFAGQRALFTWLEPLTGIGSQIAQGAVEFYAQPDADRGLPSRLLAIWMAPQTRILVINTQFRGSSSGDRSTLTERQRAEIARRLGRKDRFGIDVIWHRVWGADDYQVNEDGRMVNTAEVRYQELVLLENGVSKIDTYTADPKLLKPLLEKAIGHASDSRYRYDRSMIHSMDLSVNNVDVRRQVLVPVLQSILAGGDREIPRHFLGGPRSCRMLF